MSQKALAWLFLAAAGQVALLLLTHAGNTIGYQHFVPLGQPGSAAEAARGVLAAQAVIVALALLKRRADVARIVQALAPGWRLPVVLALFVLTSATLSRDPAAWVLELALASLAQAMQLVTVALAVASLDPASAATARRLIDRLLGPPSDAVQPGGADGFAAVLAVWTAGLAYLLAVVSYQRVPHVPDEVVYLLQARYLAQGMLTLPPPPVPEAFSLDLMTLEPARWFSPVPPGWPAMLAVGVKLGIPWLVNPLLGGLNVVLASVLLRELYPRRTARLALLLLAASPWAIYMAMNLTPHMFSLACALLAACAVARLRRHGTVRWAVLGGVMIGVVSLIRPLEAFAVALLLGFWSLGARWRGLPLIPSAVLTLATIATGALNLVYNRLITGQARTFPIMAYADQLYGPGSNAMGFGPNRGLGWSGLDPYPGHGWRDVLVNTNLNVFQLNIELLGWSCGSLLAVWLLLASGKLRRPDWQMLAVIVMIAGLHAFYWFSGGPDFGARYWFLIILPAIVLVARGLEEADARLRAPGAGDAPPGVMGVAGLLTLLALLTFVPWRAANKYRHYRGMRPDVRALARQHAFGPSLVIVRGNRHPDYHAVATENPLDLRATGTTVYAWDRGPEVNDRLLAAYPTRRVWILDGPTRTRGGYRVVAGPLTADSARAVLATP